MATNFKVRPVEESHLGWKWPSPRKGTCVWDWTCVCSHARSQMLATECQAWTWALRGSLKPLTQLSPMKRSGWWKSVIFSWWLAEKARWVSHLWYDIILPLNIVTAFGCFGGQGAESALLDQPCLKDKLDGTRRGDMPGRNPSLNRVFRSSLRIFGTHLKMWVLTFLCLWGQAGEMPWQKGVWSGNL